MPLPTKNGMQKDRFVCRDIMTRLIKRAWNRKKYCVRCGSIINRTDESNDLWNKKKKCSECSLERRSINPEEKHCSSCGEKFYEFDQSSKMKDWNSWYLCSFCKKKKQSIIYYIEEIFCLGLLDRVYKEFDQEISFIVKRKKLQKEFEKIIPGIMDALEDFLKESFKEENFDEKYQNHQEDILSTICDEFFCLIHRLNKMR
jgi:hypothetical protein